jgi:hypothetical protein
LSRAKSGGMGERGALYRRGEREGVGSFLGKVSWQL